MGDIMYVSGNVKTSIGCAAREAYGVGMMNLWCTLCVYRKREWTLGR